MGLLDRVLEWPFMAGQVCVLVLTFLIWRRYLSPLSDIPGPFFASLTRFWHIWHIWVGDQNLRLLELHERHGHFVRISHDEVSVSHPDAVKKLLLTPLPKGYWYAGLALPDSRYIAPMTVTDPKAKVELSKLLSTGYTLSNVLRAEGDMDRTIELLLGWMDQYAANQKPMDLDEYFTYATFDIVGEAVFSRPFGFLREGRDIDNSVANSRMLSFFSAASSFYRHFRNLFLTNPLMTELKILPMGHVFGTALSAINDRRADADARFDIVAHWFKMHEQHPDRLTLNNIYAQATNNVGAGADTASCGLQSFIYYSLRNPAVWARLRDEMRQAQRDGLCQSKVVSFEDALKLPYLQATIKEALRIFNPVPMGLPRTVPAGGLTLGDRTFPKGTILSVNPWIVHLSEELWGSDAKQFNPDRWFRPDAKALESKYWISFGAGYNSCPGHNVAKMEMSKILATIVRDYDISLVDEKREWKWEAYFTVLQHDWPVYVARRDKGESK